MQGIGNLDSQNRLFASNSWKMNSCAITVCFVALLCGNCFSIALAQEPPTASQASSDVERWISELRSDRFEVRQEAMKNLSIGDEKVMTRLEEELKNCDDAEQRAELRAILFRFQHEARQAKYDAFIFDPDPAQSHGIEVWDKFRKIYGSNRLIKQLLVEVYQKYPELMVSLADGKDSKEATLATVDSIRKQFKKRLPDVADGLALLFASGLIGEPLGAEFDMMTYRLTRTTPLSGKLLDGNWQRITPKLVGPWLVQTDVAIEVEAMDFGNRFGIPEAKKLAERTLAHPEGIKPRSYFEACKTMAIYGEENDLETLKPWLADARLFQTYLIPDPNFDGEFRFGQQPNQPFNGPTATCLFQDLALAASVELTKNDITEYFPTVRKMRSIDDSEETVLERWLRFGRLQSLPGFAVDKPEQRKEALKKWSDRK